MSRKTYVGVLGEVLESMGFERETIKVRGWGPYWSRMVGTVRETVELERRVGQGTTVSLYTSDTVLEALVQEAIPHEPGVRIGFGGTRIGSLTHGVYLKEWWVNDPNGPAELAAVVEERADPFFARFRSPKDQAENQYGRHGDHKRPSSSTVLLALTLYRMGEYDEALSVFRPHPRTMDPLWARRIDSVQAWLKARIGEVRDER